MKVLSGSDPESFSGPRPDLGVIALEDGACSSNALFLSPVSTLSVKRFCGLIAR